MTLAQTPGDVAGSRDDADRPVEVDPSPGPRRLAGAVCGVLAGVVVYAAHAWPLVPGPVWVLWVGLAVLAVPTADDVATRISRNGLVVLGWAPILWAVRLPALDRAGLLVALSTGLLVGWLVSSAKPAASARRLVPTARPVDWLLVVSAAAAVLTMWRFLRVGSARQALALLLPGYDNVAHFDMFRMIWRHGGTVDTVPRLPGHAPWAYDSYPQGLHSLLATWAELRYPGGTSDAHALVVYSHGVAVVVVVGVVVTVATLLSLPGLDRRGWYAVPVVSVVLTAFLWSPGGWVIEDGFANYWLAAALAGCAYAVAYSRVRSVPTVVDEVALMACMVGVVLGWAPLLGVCALAGLVGSGLVRRSAWSRPRVTLVRVALGVLAACVGVRTLHALVTTVPSASLLGAAGAIHSMSPVPVLVLLVLHGCLLSVSYAVRRRTGQSPDRGTRLRELALSCGVALGVLVCVVVAILQVRANGTTSYYFVKLFMGFGLVLVVATSALSLTVAAALPESRGRRRQLVALACVAGALLVTQLFGRVAPGRVPPLVGVAHPLDDDGRSLSWPRMADGVLAAEAAVPTGASVSYEYVALGSDRGYRADLPNAWFHAVSGSLLDKELGLTLALDSPSSARAPILAILDSGPRTQVLVPEAELDAVKEVVGPAYAARVHGAGSVEPEGER